MDVYLYSYKFKIWYSRMLYNKNDLVKISLQENKYLSFH